MYPLLKGLRIVDITTIILGPYATQILGDLGAEVIKVETLDGDMNRTTPPHGAPGIGAVFANNNRNKRSLAVDLKSAEGKDILRRLIGTADALVHNMRQDALDRLGFSWETVHALNPRLIIAQRSATAATVPMPENPPTTTSSKALRGSRGSTSGAMAHLPIIPW